MKANFLENFCVGSGGVGTVLSSISFAEFRDLMGIIYLIIQSIILLIGVCIKIYKALKDDGKIDEKEMAEIKNDLDKIGGKKDDNH